MPSTSDPPDLPISARYTSCYCEENIYLLAQDFAADPLISSKWDTFVVFISNHSKTVSSPYTTPLSLGLTVHKLPLYRLLSGVRNLLASLAYPLYGITMRYSFYAHPPDDAIAAKELRLAKTK